eukprot:CAMPEP_0116872098 /NCGR_PEP_ID=MMETSP0463-20121206/2757_1 /TAXON_ID=181622 /ORGANISM="Strombidinopsis sp, Strain SopsisLIS2011" /LENGTH=86 /DNA_ID=CAMNT_0004511797 /DNA_START=905 /DNA_END=1165 /DNA_ORIENTATION=+
MDKLGKIDQAKHVLAPLFVVSSTVMIDLDQLDFVQGLGDIIPDLITIVEDKFNFEYIKKYKGEDLRDGIGSLMPKLIFYSKDENLV